MKNLGILKKKKSRTFISAFMMIMLSMSFLIIFASCSLYIYYKEVKNNTVLSYTAQLNRQCYSNDEKIQNIIDTTNIFCYQKSLMNVLSSTYSDADVTSSEEIIKNLRYYNKFINSISIVNRGRKRVYSTFGEYNFDDYFENKYVYKDYDADYWEAFMSPRLGKVILPPSKVESMLSDKKDIIPIVFTKFSDTPTSNLLIINIDVSKLIQSAKSTVLTDNAVFGIINKTSKQVFFRPEDAEYIDTLSDDALSLIVSGNTNFDYRLNNKDNLIISYSNSTSLLGYSYIAIIPYDDIYKATPSRVYIILGFGFVTTLLTLILSYFSTNRIFRPFRRLLSLFPEGSKKSDYDTLHELEQSITEILNSNQNLTKQIADTLPMKQENYLIHLLNYGSDYIKKQEENIPSFEYDYFCSIITKIRPTNQFYSLYNSDQYATIQRKIYDLIYSTFNKSFKSFTLNSENNAMYILLNPEKGDCENEINDIIENFKSITDADKNYITLTIQHGGVYSGLDGLKKSHDEALEKTWGVAVVNQVNLTPSSADTHKSQVVSIDEENKLIGALMMNNYDNAVDIANKIISKITPGDYSAFTDTYLHIAETIFSVKRMKDKSYDSTEYESEIISHILNKPISQVYEIITGLLEQTTKKAEDTTPGNIDINDIITYINNNFNKDISLTSLAELFYTTPKYMSKLIKQKLGITFVDYLAHVRIAKAKELLTNADISISDVITETGFNNRNTFVRTFKRITDMTPSEFRKQNTTD